MTQADAMRKLIVSQAVNAIYRGGHYLAGTTGQYTGETDPRLKRTLESVNDPSYKTLGIRTATIGKWRCRGRCDRVGGRTMPATTATRDAIQNYIRTHQERGIPPAQWIPFEGNLYPRRSREDGAIYIGESCEGRQHFDCIGLVNYSIRRSIALPATYDMFQWFEGGGGSAEILDPPEQSKLKDGDILLRMTFKKGAKDDNKLERTEVIDGHIALVSKEGVVLEASDFPIGTNHKPYIKKEWTHVARLKEHYLKQ